MSNRKIYTKVEYKMHSKYVKTSIESIRAFLEVWPNFSSEFLFTKQEILNNQELFVHENASFSWCHLYELHFNEHVVIVNNSIIKLIPDLLDVYKALASKQDQVGAIPDFLNKFDNVLSKQEFAKNSDVAREFAPNALKIYFLSTSLFNTFKSFAVFGKSINELLKLARAGEDSALFDAIRIDKTVIGCPTAVERISRAEFFENADFFKKLQKALNGKLGVREHKNYQKMRLVFEILHEVGADKLSDDDLYELFVKELKIYPWDAKEGGNAKALRKFADTYMNKKSNT